MPTGHVNRGIRVSILRLSPSPARRIRDNSISEFALVLRAVTRPDTMILAMEVSANWGRVFTSARVFSNVNPLEKSLQTECASFDHRLVRATAQVIDAS